MGVCSGSKPWLYLSICGLVIFIVGIILVFAAIPAIIKSQIAKQVRLEEGTEQFDRFEELPINLEFKVYMFHVTNPVEVTNDGAKPIVEEKGPYIYSLRRWKENLTYISTEDTYTYYQYSHYEFDANASAPFTEDDIITILNVPLNSLFQIIESLVQLLRSIFELLGFGSLGEFIIEIIMELFVNGGWPNMFPDTNTMFHDVRVGDILFDGHKFCDLDITGMDDISDENIGSVVCCLAMGLLGLKNIVQQNNFDYLEYSFFSFKQNSHDEAYNVYSGLDDVKDLGYIRDWDGRTFTETWDEKMSTCNKVRGRDSTIYPPYIEEEDSFDIFSTDICRVVNIRYDGEDEHLDITGQKRVLREDTFASAVTNPANECFCTKSTKNLYGETKCLPDGFMDMKPCLSTPIVLSFPHFLHADEEYSSTVEGLSPDIENHTTYALLEPNTGSPLRGAKRMQFNQILRPIPGVTLTSKLTHSMIPIMWVDEGVAIDDELADIIKDSYFDLIEVVDIIKWIVVALGAAIFVCSGGFYIYKKKTN